MKNTLLNPFVITVIMSATIGGYAVPEQVRDETRDETQAEPERKSTEQTKEQPEEKRGQSSAFADPLQACVAQGDNPCSQSGKACLLDLFPVTEKSIEKAMTIDVSGTQRTDPDEQSTGDGIRVCIDSVEKIDQKLPSLKLLSGNLNAMPGGLTLFGRSLAQGHPVPIPLKRKPASLLIDLPGAMTDQPILINNPNNPSEIYAAIDKALSGFYDRIEETAQKDTEEKSSKAGHVGGYTISHMESSSDLLAKVKLGFNAEDKASGMKGEIDINATTKSKTRVLYTKFQQTVFQVIADPVSYEDIFDDSVTAAQLYRAIRDPENPEKIQTLAIHSRGIFGRVILLKSTFHNVSETADLKGAMNYALAGQKFDIETENEFKRTLKNVEFSLTVVGATNIPIITDHTLLMAKINETMELRRESRPALLEVTTIAVQNGLPAKTTYGGQMVTTTCTKYDSGFVDFKSTDWRVKGTLETVTWNLKDLTTGKLITDATGAPKTESYRYNLSGSGKAPAVDLPSNAVNILVRVYNCGLGDCNKIIWENKYSSGPPNVCLSISAYGVLYLKSEVYSVKPGRCN